MIALRAALLRALGGEGGECEEMVRQAERRAELEKHIANLDETEHWLGLICATSVTWLAGRELHAHGKLMILSRVYADHVGKHGNPRQAAKVARKSLLFARRQLKKL